MGININKEQVQAIGEVGLKVGKKIILEGTKAVLIKGAVAALETSFDNGLKGFKGMSLDRFLGNDPEFKKEKVSFRRKKKVVVETEEVADEAIQEIVDEMTSKGD